MQDVGGRYGGGLTLLSLLAGVVLIQTWVTHPPHLTGELAGPFLLVYAVMLTVSWVFPVRVGDQSIHVLLGLEVPMFLQFGVIPTVLVVNLTWVIGQLLARREIHQRRLLANMSMFTLLIIASALAYELAGGLPTPFVWTQPLWLIFVPVTVFFIAHFVLNDVMMLFLSYLRDGRIHHWAIGVQWDLIAVVIDFLLAWMFLGLRRFYGFEVFVYGGIAFIALTYVFRLYSNLVFANQQLSTISAVTRRLSMQLTERDLLQSLVHSVPQVVPATACYVFAPQGNALLPVAVHGSSAEMELQMRKVSVELGMGLTGAAFVRQEMMMRKSRWPFTGKLENTEPLPAGASVIALPLLYNGVVMGVLVLTHSEPNVFTSRDVEMVQILANHASIGWWNARRFMQTELQSVTDQLTGVYNYRYFASVIDELCQKTDVDGGSLTLLVLDLDYFKQINDSYGHQVGNEVLKLVSQCLKANVRDGDIVCRFGGEEFTVILPGTSLETGMQVAERLRGSVESSPLRLKGTDNTTVMPIRVTVSVGAATYPEHSDSAHSLLLNADRAMYLGSKQKGRNRVAAYKSFEGEG